MGLISALAGSPVDADSEPAIRGSIPAHAGEPPASRPSGTAPWVYPRACGGTTLARLRWCLSRGLSPRMRGNRLYGVAELVEVGSIPAHAGEPRNPAGARSSARVYPRACGGTKANLGGARAIRGLSPRMRGNRPWRRRESCRCGSIPADAGEPTTSPGPSRPRRVYPRACGGTSGWDRSWEPFTGLSPRMRGNLRLRSSRNTCSGSIPAHAGEPPATKKRGSYETGLSPRMRGNP